MNPYFITFHRPIRMRDGDELVDFDLSVVVRADSYRDALAAVVREPVEASSVTIEPVRGEEAS